MSESTRTAAPLRTLGRHCFTFVFGVFVGATVYVLGAAGYAWFVLEQRATYNVGGPIPTLSEPMMIAPAVLIGMLMWRVLERPERCPDLNRVLYTDA